jgi:hypothetical protein
MSDGDTDDESTSDRFATRRRSVLQGAALGLGGLSLAGLSDRTTAKTGCARGPFEASYEPGTVNVGRIRAEQAREQRGPDSMGASSPASTDQAGGVDPAEAASSVQSSMDDDDGPLSIDDEFDGVNSLETRGGVPSDSQVAVGNGRLMHVLNRDIAIYDKNKGRREQFFRLERLWEPVIPEPEGDFVFDIPFVFDPRARYDRNNDRFILCATQFQFGIDGGGGIIDREDLEEGALEGENEVSTEAVSRPPKGWFLVAVSATSNPNGKWYVYRVPPEGASGVDNIGLVDYPTLGFDKDAIYLTQNFFGAEFDITMVTLDKAAMYAGETVTAHHFDGMSDPDADGLTFTVQPAQQPFSGGNDGTFYLVNSDFPFPDPKPETLTLWELTNPLDDPSLECFTLDVDPYVYPLSARQPVSNSLIDTLGTRLMNADFNDGSLWTAHSTAIPGEGRRPVAGVRWYEIDVDSRSVVQSGTYGTPERSTFMPTIGSDGDSTVIAHNVSGPETYPRMDVGGRTADHTQGELEDNVVVEEGKSKYDALAGPGERWGDYNGVSVDPVSGKFWTVSQYSPDIDIPVEHPERDPYATRIAEVSFEDEKEGGGGGRGRDAGRGR